MYVHRELLSDISDLVDYVYSVKKLHPNNRIILLGDFNMPEICWADTVLSKNLRSFQRDFLTILEDLNLTQLVDRPTHIHGNILDLFCTDLGPLMIETEVIAPGISDHFLVSACFSANLTFNSNLDKSTLRLFHKTNLVEFRNALHSVNNDLDDRILNGASVDEVWQTFKNGFIQAINTHVPSKLKRKKHPHEPIWFNLTAKKACDKQRKLYIKHKKSGDPDYLSQYKMLRRENKRLFKSLKKEYMFNVLYNPLLDGDSKSFFKHVKNVKGSNNTIHSLVTDSGNITQNRFEIVQTLNDFFKSVFAERVQLPALPLPSHQPIDISELGIVNLLTKLKKGKAPGPDGITGRMLCLDSQSSAVLLAKIFNLSMKSGKLPNEWKTANVTPIFKSGKRILSSNYRPVSLTSICCKLLEHIVLHNLAPQLDSLLCSNQHGFRRSLSCSTQLVTLTQDLAGSFEHGEEVHAAVLDFSKAFDMVPHHSLIRKLSELDINSYITRWVADFLSDRTQRVVLQGTESSLVGVTSGVPQGSVLGPTLFLIYINDIVNSVDCSKIRLFADDTLLYKSVSCVSDTKDFQNDLDKLYVWSIKNSMKVNAKKSNVIIFNSKQNAEELREYSLNGNILERTETVKYLGVYLNHKLSWDAHIDYILSKASSMLGLMKYTLQDAPAKIKKLAYYTLCRPVLEYGCEAWDPHHKQLAHRLEIFQNKAIRFIFNLKGREVSISKIRLENQIATLEKRRQSSRRIALFHNNLLSSGALHPSLCELLNLMQTNDLSVSTRSNTFNSLYAKTNTYLQRFFYKNS